MVSYVVLLSSSHVIVRVCSPERVSGRTSGATPARYFFSCSAGLRQHASCAVESTGVGVVLPAQLFLDFLRTNR